MPYNAGGIFNTKTQADSPTGQHDDQGRHAMKQIDKSNVLLSSLW